MCIWFQISEVSPWDASLGSNSLIMIGLTKPAKCVRTVLKCLQWANPEIRRETKKRGNSEY